MSNDPMIISGVIIMALGIVIPCLLWFIRNLFRVFLEKDVWWLNNYLKTIWFSGLVAFVIGLVLLIIKVSLGSGA